ncbi:unnamed protein product [Echinostoma caproni]|uniref:PDZ domain-containing protein n=1 Tax=Echinostoma caproni TaxID=27848 RepID=A0A183AYD6_9TREM|nr:unnamed protein product [Echinostoma caproni]
MEKHDREVLPVVSPTSSPEDDCFTYSGHELLVIESSEQCSSYTEAVDDHISDSCSLPTSQQQTLEDLENPQTEDVKLFFSESNRGPFRDTSTLEYMNQLQRDTSEAPYVSLVSKAPREVQSNGSVLERLRKLQRRLNSDRSIWLHQRALSGNEGRDTTLFRIDLNQHFQSVGIPGVVGFRATLMEPPGESLGANAVQEKNEIASRMKPVILFLPVSGVHCRSGPLDRDSTVLLGDTIKPGDVLRAFSPW